MERAPIIPFDRIEIFVDCGISPNLNVLASRAPPNRCTVALDRREVDVQGPQIHVVGFASASIEIRANEGVMNIKK